MRPEFWYAMTRLPECCELSVADCVEDTGETIESIRAGVEHEIALYRDGNDGCINRREYDECVRYLRRIGK